MEEYTPDIVSIVDEEGKEHIFEELDRSEYDDGENHSFIMREQWEETHDLTMSYVRNITMNNTVFTVNE